jgi:hypothetical protein
MAGSSTAAPVITVCCCISDQDGALLPASCTVEVKIYVACQDLDGASCILPYGCVGTGDN